MSELLLTHPELEQEPPAVPFDEFLLKIESRCNLACDYCYVYEMADQSWQNQPLTMSPETMIATAERVREHVDENEVEKATIIFHGGEALLADKRDPGFFLWATSLFRNIVGEDRVEFGTQSNGVLLTQQVIDRLINAGIGIGISLDGPPAIHNKHRTYRNGNGSYHETARGLRLLNKNFFNRQIYGGILTTIMLEGEPLQTYSTLRQFDPPAIDFLLPLGTWDNPPPKREPGTPDTPYADWLIPIFDKWWAEGHGKETRIRIFDEILRLTKGLPSNVEYLGLGAPRNIVVESNGAIQQVDGLKAVAENAPDLGLNVRDNSFKEALHHPLTRHRQLGLAALSRTCQQCELVNVCGGGHDAHRFGNNRGYDNPAIYCPDLTKIITYIDSSLQRTTRLQAIRQLGEDRRRE